MQEGLYILYQFNEKYAPYAGVSMTSLFENNRAAESIYIYVLGEELSQDSIDRLNNLADRYGRQICFINADSLIETMKKLNMPSYRGSYAANLRLFVAEIIGQTGEEFDRLLYLDADTIVTGDLRQMYRSTIKTVGMVYDCLGSWHKYDLGLEEADGYYNSGVILYDLDKWQKNDYTRKIIDHVKNVRAQYPSPDQDLINIILKGDITPLGIEYNYQPHLREYSYDSFVKAFTPKPFYSKQEVINADRKPIIMHAYRYIGEFCWHKNNMHPFNEEFDKYLALSTWSDYRKDKSESTLALKVEKILYKILPKSLFLCIFKIMHMRFYQRAVKLSKQNEISVNM